MTDSTSTHDATSPLRVAVDIVVFTVADQDLKVLLIKRGIEPYKGAWALPGGFVLEDESVDDAARRELAEETSVEDIYLEQLYTFGEVDRDPRTRVVTVAYFALIDADSVEIHGGTDASQAAWHSMYSTPTLAFDHDTILGLALRRLRYKLEYAPVAFQLLPDEFTLSQLQATYEVILAQPLDKRNFRRKILGLDILRDTGRTRSDGPHRPARLFAFRQDRFEQATGGKVIFSF